MTDLLDRPNRASVLPTEVPAPPQPAAPLPTRREKALSSRARVPRHVRPTPRAASSDTTTPALRGPAEVATPVANGAPATVSRSRWYFPAVDGMRGLAIASVLLYHTNWTPRGLFGVDVFFVVSGFLITLLLLRELQNRGRINLRRFYVRRIKRLVPGLVIVLGATLAMLWQFGSTHEFESAASKTLGALGQVANWQQIVSGVDYWDSFAAISPLAHMWSLSITEQFYVVWPLVVIAVWWMTRRSALATWIVLTLLLAASALVAPLMFDGDNGNRLYLGTESRAVGFVAGAAASAVVFWWMSRRSPRRALTRDPGPWARVTVTTLSFTSLSFVVVASVMTTSYLEPWLYRGGLAAVAVAAAIFTATLCTPANALVRFFSFSVFVAFGKISYSAYLVHLPVYWALTTLTPSISPLTLFLVGGLLTCIIAAFLHHAITERMRKATWKATRGIPALVAGTAIIVAGAVYLPQHKTDAPPLIQRPVTAAGHTALPVAPAPTSIPAGIPTILTVGDSLANDFATMLRANATQEWNVRDAGIGGCGLMSPERVRSSGGYVWEDQERCADWETTMPGLIADTAPDAVLVHASWDAADQQVDGSWLTPCSTGYTERYTAQLDKLRESTETNAPGARLLLATERPTNGIISTPATTSCYNDLLAQYAAAHDSVFVLPWDTLLCPDGQCADTDQNGRALFLSDDVHLSPAGLAALAPWLENALDDVLPTTPLSS